MFFDFYNVYSIRLSNTRYDDGSAYYPPIEKKAQILQKMRRIPIEVTVCLVDWRVNIGWCGGEYTALNYMHSDIETKRTKRQPNNVQCHHASPNDTLELEILEYGSINSIRLMMNLDGGVGEASFQPIGYSRPNSDCEGTPFTPPINDQNTISYIDYRRHFQEKEQWSTDVIHRAVVTYQLSVNVMKKTAYLINDGQRIVIPDLVTINRTEKELYEDLSSRWNILNNMGIEIINKDLEGYRDAALGTIVFNKTTVPKTSC